VVFGGGVPVPVDIGPDNLIDVCSMEEAMTTRTRFVMPVHVNGRVCDMVAIQEVCDAHGLKIVEDAAQALGARLGGRMAGTFGVAASFSFYPAKVLGCLGDGGIVVTDEPDVADRLYQLRDHGRDADGEIRGWGLNSRLDTIQAAVLHLQFEQYEEILRHRRSIASAYDRRLSSISALTLPAPPVDDGEHFDIFQNYEIEAERRDELQHFLREGGVGTLTQWGGKGIHQFQSLGLSHYSLPAADRFFERCLMLPMNMMVTVGEAESISDLIEAFYAA
jgi:dTDP-4-amino-4,6-dideoxygalactose transaminase